MEEAYKSNPDIPYPAKEIQNQDWNTIASAFSGIEYKFDEINPKLSDYIIKDNLEDGSTVEEIANEE